MNFYSQLGEDKWIHEHIGLPERGVIMEVGVGRWREFSNSLHFEEAGWQTFLVEPNPDLHPEIEANRRGRLLKFAAGPFNGTTNFTLENEPTVSGIRRAASGHNCREIVVEMRTLAEICAIARVPHSIDVLSIDTEGTEMDVWQSLDLRRNKPRVVIIEYSTCGFPERPIPIIQRFLDDGYRLVHTTAGNLIFTAT